MGFQVTIRIHENFVEEMGPENSVTESPKWYQTRHFPCARSQTVRLKNLVVAGNAVNAAMDQIPLEYALWVNANIKCAIGARPLRLRLKLCYAIGETDPNNRQDFG